MANEDLIIPDFPEFVELEKKYQISLKDLFLSLKDGISELTFDSLIIHNGRFNHKISKIPNSLNCSLSTSPNSFLSNNTLNSSSFSLLYITFSSTISYCTKYTF